MDVVKFSQFCKSFLHSPVNSLFRELGGDFGSVEWAQVWKQEPKERTPISTLDDWMQHAEKPRRLMSFNELRNLITKFFPSKIEELLQVEKERERLTSLMEDFENCLTFSEWWCSYISRLTLSEWWCSYMSQVKLEVEQIKFMMEQVKFKFEQIKFMKEQIKLAEKRMYCDKGDGAVSDIVYPILEEMIFEHNHNALNVLEKFHSRYPRDLKITQLLEKIKRISGFLLGVVVLVIYQYLMGYVETGRWNTYSNGSWEFRATYVCIELRLGSYPFQKFRETTKKFTGVSERTYNTKAGVTFRYKPWVWFRKRIFYFERQTTAEKAARIRDVAKFWLRIKGRKGQISYNFGEEDYNYLNFVQEFHPQQSDDEIKRLVLEHAQPFLKEVQQSQEVPIVYQPPCVELVRFANGEDNTIQGLSAYVDMLEAFLLDDTNEQTADMIEEPQLVSPNKDIAGPTIEENSREHQQVLISSTGSSLIESGCTSQITLIAPCDGTGAAVDLFTELKVFRKENWSAKTGVGAKLSCALEGCSATMHKFAFLQKSCENQELWPVDIWAKLDAFRFRGWKIEL